jgi:hypothetical protein
MQYASFPMPAGHPDYLGHELIARYLDDFTDHFGFRAAIRFRTEVTGAAPAPDRAWDVTVRSRDTGQERTGRYAAVLVASGHHWDPRYPDPALPGAGTYTGRQLHSHHYRGPEPYVGRRVLVVGLGNSACDIATECAPVAARTFLAVRRGAHIVPKYLFGVPTDRLTLMRLATRMPFAVQRLVAGLLVRAAQGPPTRYGLPKPDHRLLGAPPTMSDGLLSRLGHGDITVKPAVTGLRGTRAQFADGTAEQIDAVIYCTGYKISFPFLGPGLAPTGPSRSLALYRRVVPPALPGLYFIGLVQPIAAVIPIAEAQSHWVADLLQGRAALPPAARMSREIAGYHAAIARRYAPSSRPPIQVDFLAYQREIRRERRAGAARVPPGGQRDGSSTTVRPAAAAAEPIAASAAPAASRPITWPVSRPGRSVPAAIRSSIGG